MALYFWQHTIPAHLIPSTHLHGAPRMDAWPLDQLNLVDGHSPASCKPVVETAEQEHERKAAVLGSLTGPQEALCFRIQRMA